MINLQNINDVKTLQSNLRATFDTAQGKESMLFLEELCKWFPTALDSNETNDIIARDANRRVLGTLKTLLEHSAEDIVSWAKTEEV